MRLLTFRTSNGTRAGRLEGDTVVELDAPDVAAVLRAQSAGAATRETGATHRYEGLDLAPPVIDPTCKVICLGQNYEAHIKEQSAERPKFPTLFNKFPESIIGPRDDIVLPAISERADWEVELAFIVGRPIRRAGEDEAGAAIAGWTVLNDVSIRDWQHRTSQWMQGKAWERTTPVGPVLVTADELDAANLRVTTQVDGRLMQDSTTADLVFKPHQVAAYISEFITLKPGDLVATGTPGGVGDYRQPPVYMAHGSVLRTAIEGIGELHNRCVKEGRD